MKFIEGKKIIIYGTNVHAVKAKYILNTHSIDIQCFCSDSYEGSFIGKNVKKIESILETHCYILVACEWNEYTSKRNILIKNGLVEFVDFVYYEWIYKKIAILHGNCHMDIIKEYLDSSVRFKEMYSFYPNPPVFLNKCGRIDEKAMAYCDLFLHEDIQAENKYGYYLSDDYTLSIINKSAICITIPNLFGYGACIFPQYVWNKENIPINDGKDLNGMFPHGDTIIDKLMEVGCSEEKIIEICKGDCFDDKYIIENYNNYMEKIRERNAAWDVDVYSFIINNVHCEKLFYDRGHPTNTVLRYITEQVLAMIGIFDEEIYCYSSLDKHEEPIYPQVRRVLKLQFEEKPLRKSAQGKKCSEEMNFENYIREYIWWKQQCMVKN